MIIGLAGAFLVVALSTAAQSQSGLDAARDLYVAADYEAALAAFDRLASDEDATAATPDIDRYRALCLIALGRAAEADQVIEGLRADSFWMMGPPAPSDQVVSKKAASILARGEPD